MVEQGVIDPYEAAAKQKRNRKGGVAYLIEHLDLSGPEPVVIKRYVGITATSKEERFKGHVTDARRGRIGHNTDKSLEAAIRMEIKRGNEKILDKLFLLIHLDEAPTDQELSEMEGRYVAEFGTMTPHGYNIHPPGSLGGLGNAKPMSFEDDGELIEVDSFGDAWRYHVKKYGPDRVPNLSAARARHKEAITADWKGWSIARVFGVDEDQVD